MVMVVVALPAALAYLVMRAAGELLWSVFGNDDDPRPPATWRADWSEWRRLLVWYVARNPLHNLFFYRLGVVGREWRVAGRFPSASPSGVEMWPPAPYRVAWCVHIHPGHDWLRLPFMSWRVPLFGRGVEGYLGWRPSGSLGASLRLLRSTAA